MNFRKTLVVMMMGLFVVVSIWTVNKARAGWAVHNGWASYIERTCSNGMVIGIGEFGLNIYDGMPVFTNNNVPLTVTSIESGPSYSDSVLPDYFATELHIIRWQETLKTGDIVQVGGDLEDDTNPVGIVNGNCKIESGKEAPSRYLVGNGWPQPRYCGQIDQSDSLNFPADLTIYDVDVSLWVDQPATDTTAKLTSPFGTSIQLFNVSSGNLGSTCSDYPNNNILGTRPDFHVDDEFENEENWNYGLIPPTPLASFDGENAAGKWQLNVNGGILKCWCLDIIGSDSTIMIIDDLQHGDVLSSPNKEIYNIGEKVMLTADPDPGYKFQGWGGDLSGSQNPIQITMNGDLKVSANFNKEPTAPPQSDGNASFIPVVMAASAGSGPPPTNATPTYTATPSPTATPTATATYTPTPTPTSTSEPFNGAIPNGGFESGPSNWYEYSALGFPLILSDFELPVGPRSGSWAAWLGGGDDEYTYLEQTLNLHNSTTQLTFFGWVDSSDPDCGFDFAFVELENASKYDYFAYDLCEITNTYDWVQYWIPVDIFAGETVTVRIGLTTDEVYSSSFYLDDAAFSNTSLSINTEVATQFSAKSKQSAPNQRAIRDANVYDDTAIKKKSKR